MSQRKKAKSSSAQLNLDMLLNEFPQMDAGVVRDVYNEANKDTDVVRRILNEMMGIQVTVEEKLIVPGELEIQEIQGDLFKGAAADSLCHCVSECLAMGKGIAVLFKKKFGGVASLKRQAKTIGEVAVLERDGRYVYYLITKARYFNKPTMANLKRSLEAMRAHADAHGVTHLSMPRIGCGLDGLIWRDVKAMVVEVFTGSAVSLIKVFRL